MAEVVPAIMPKSLADLREKIARVRRYVSFVQLDIMDGLYVAPKSWPFRGAHGDFPAIALDMPFEVDLMVADPGRAAHDWIAAGARRLIFHIERTRELKNTLAYVRATYPKLELGLAILNDTESATLEPYLPLIDVVQFMGIAHIGYQGEPFDERVLRKVAAWRATHPEATISVDGAVNAKTAHRLVEAGANRLVSGSYIFEDPDIAHAITTLTAA